MTAPGGTQANIRNGCEATPSKTSLIDLLVRQLRIQATKEGKTPEEIIFYNSTL